MWGEFIVRSQKIWNLIGQNACHVKTKGLFAGTATRNLTNTPAVIFSYPCRGRWFIFMKQIIIVLFWIIIYSYLLLATLFTTTKFFKIGVLKNFSQFTRKHLCRSFFSISQYPAAFLIRDSDIDGFLWILRNYQEHHFYKPPWDSYFCIYWTYL